MNQAFKYNGNTKCSTKSLKGVYSGNDLLVLNVYMNEKLQSVKIQRLNTFKDRHVVAKSGSAAESFNERPLSNAL